MAIPAWSNQAQNASKKLYRVDHIIYVESDFDVEVWKIILGYFAPQERVKVKPAGNCIEVDKYIERIIKNNLSIIAIRDSDYVVASKKAKSHDRVIYTYGYSIENTIFNPVNLANYISLLTGNNHSVAKVDRWLTDLSASLQDLIIYDLANVCAKKYVTVLGDKAQPLLKNNGSSHEVDPIKVAAAKTRLTPLFSTYLKRKYTRLYLGSKKKRYLLIRGHFLESIVYNYVKYHYEQSRGGKMYMSTDMLIYNLMCNISKGVYSKSESNYLTKRIDRAVLSSKAC